MKDLEDDAIRAQAVIAKAQELQNDESQHSTPSQNGQTNVSRSRRDTCDGAVCLPGIPLVVSYQYS